MLTCSSQHAVTSALAVASAHYQACFGGLRLQKQVIQHRELNEPFCLPLQRKCLDRERCFNQSNYPTRVQFTSSAGPNTAQKWAGNTRICCSTRWLPLHRAAKSNSFSHSKHLPSSSFECRLSEEVPACLNSRMFWMEWKEILRHSQLCQQYVFGSFVGISGDQWCQSSSSSNLRCISQGGTCFFSIIEEQFHDWRCLINTTRCLQTHSASYPCPAACSFFKNAPVPLRSHRFLLLQRFPLQLVTVCRTVQSIALVKSLYGVVVLSTHVSTCTCEDEACQNIIICHLAHESSVRAVRLKPQSRFRQLWTDRTPLPR